MKIAYKTNRGVYIVNSLDGSGIPEGVEKATGEFPDMFFRQAWDIQGGNLVIDLQKAKDVAHQTRRHLRELEFEPYDERIMKQIPGWETAEEERVKIRQKYEVMQNEINLCTDTESLKKIIT